MRLGIDVSILDQLEAQDPHYYHEGKEIEPISYFHDHNGVDLMRLRLWLDPYDEKGTPYGAGTNDLPCFLRLARRGIEAGYGILLDFHYSDFWVDPAKQFIPKAWQNFTYEEVVKAVGDYTRETLQKIKAEGIDLYAIQVGNEITHGMLWPHGSVHPETTLYGFDHLSEILKAGLAACKEVYPKAKTVLHLEHSGSKELQETWLREVIGRDVEFDVLGESYYPYWHGSMKDLAANIDNIHALFNKEVWIVEVGYAYCPAKRDGKRGLANLIDDDFYATHSRDQVPYPFTQEGQRDFFLELFDLCKKHEVTAVFYWEPLWIDLPHNGWAGEAGQAYIHEEGDAETNEWANQLLFDEKGNATLAFDVYKV